MADSAAKALNELGNVLADVHKRLGKKGKLPKPRADPKVALTKSVAMAKALEDDVKKLIKSLKDYQTTLSDVDGDSDDYSKLIAKSDFNLSKADPDEEKTIYYVQYNLTKCLDGISLGSQSPRKEAAKVLDALNGADLTGF